MPIAQNRAKRIKYTPELAKRICVEIAEGKSLRSICKNAWSPGIAAMWDWLNLHPEFAEQYARAKLESADAIAEDIHEIADGALSGKYDANAARVAMDGKKWIASKLKPKKYGDKLDLTSGGDKLPTPIYGGLSADTRSQTDGDTGA